MTELKHGLLRDEWRRNWRLPTAATIIVAFSFQTFQTSSSLFVVPLQQAFGWTRAEIAFTHNAYLGAAAASLLIGRAVDRWGAWVIMLAGMAVTIATYCALAAMNGSLPLFYALYMALGVAGVVQSGLTCSRLVSEAFVCSRGFTLGITRSGIGLVGSILPSLLLFVITAHGWRAGFAVEAALVATIALPAALFWIGRSSGGRATSAQPRAVPPSYRSLLGDRRVIVLCAAAALGYSPTAAVLTQLQPCSSARGWRLLRPQRCLALPAPPVYLAQLDRGCLSIVSGRPRWRW